MGRPAKFNSTRERRDFQNERRKAERQARDTEFLGVDGEGTGRGTNHRYVLLGCGSEYISEESGLSFTDIASFLWGCYLRNRNHVFAGFYLSYDFTQWLKNLPENRAWYLFTDAGITRRRRTSRSGAVAPFPVRWEGWEFDLLGMKRFKLRPEGEKSWLYINDAGPFFQSSFLSAIDPEKWEVPVCSDAEFAAISAGKSKRDTAALDSEMIAYNALENEILARTLKELNSGFIDAGVRLKRSQWFGPGQAAQAWLNTQVVPTTTEIKENKLLVAAQDIARKAYFGGWFEIMAHGIIPGTSHEYDINSAYPHIARQLPCLFHGTWTRQESIPGTRLDDSLVENGGWDTLRILYARVSGSHYRIGAMLHRLPDGNILRPHSTEGWYWAHELAAARRAGVVDHVDIQESWTYQACDCPRPLRRLANLYDYRIAVGKNSPKGKSAKLLYNSVYGKFAQSIGDPKYGNAIYASLITSGCRTQILDAIATHPEGAGAVLMVATDAIFFRSPHRGLALSGNIGEWESTERENLTLFKPGVYWDDATRAGIAAGAPAIFKSRGVSAKAFSATISEIDSHFGEWATSHYPITRDPESFREGWYPKVKFNAGFTMITCKQALARHKWHLAGAVGEAEVEQDSWPGVKRLPGEVTDGVFWSRPWPDLGEPSAPYEKKFGIDDEDWMTEDGYGGMLIAEALKG
jgi:hypothetical protein